MDNESGQMADSGGQHPQSMKCVDATGAMLRSDMAGDDDGETVTDSEERPQDEDEAKLVQQRAQQKRRFTAARTSLEREFGKDNPSLRYLKKGRLFAWARFSLVKVSLKFLNFFLPRARATSDFSTASHARCFIKLQK